MEVRTSRVKAAAVAVGCAVLTAVFAAMAQSAALAWLGVGIFGLGVLASGKRAFLPTTMFRLEDRQLVIVGGLRGRPTVPWSQIKAVEIRSRGLRGSAVVLTIADGEQGRRVEFTDTWLDKRGSVIAQAIADRAGGWT